MGRESLANHDYQGRSQAVSVLPETTLVAEGGGVNSKMRMRSMHARPREKRQRVEHIISCHSQEVSVAVTASTSLFGWSFFISPASSPRSSRSAARIRGDIGANQMSDMTKKGSGSYKMPLGLTQITASPRKRSMGKSGGGVSS